jgi:hypothetical protein
MPELTEMANTFIALAAAAAKDLNEQQSELQLESIFYPDHLLSATGRTTSLAKLAAMQALLDKHREVYSRYSVSYSSQMVGLTSSLPEKQQAEEVRKLAEKQQQLLDEQAYFFKLRESWIENVTNLVRLFERASDTVGYDGEYVIFQNDDEAGEFNELRTAIDEIANAERELFQTRMTRLQSNISILGFNRF